MAGESDMEIDWKKIHDELGPEYVAVVWNENGKCAASRIKEVCATCIGVWRPIEINENASWEFPAWLDGKCPGEWDKVLLEFPGHYGAAVSDKPAISYVDVLEIRGWQQETVDAGKEAAAKMKKLDAAIKAFDEFIAAHGKKFDAAGLEIMFREKV